MGTEIPVSAAHSSLENAPLISRKTFLVSILVIISYYTPVCQDVIIRIYFLSAKKDEDSRRRKPPHLDPKNSGFNAMASHFDTENVVSVRQTTHYQILDNPSIVWYNITS